MNKQFDKLKNRIEALNKLNAFINDKAPQLIAHNEKHAYKVKASSISRFNVELFKRDREALEAILGERPKDFTMWFEAWDTGTLWLNVKTHYTQSAPDSNGVTVAAYISDQVCIGTHNGKEKRPFEPRPIYDLDEWRKEHARLEQLREQRDAIASEIRRIEYVTEGR